MKEGMVGAEMCLEIFAAAWSGWRSRIGMRVIFFLIMSASVCAAAVVDAKMHHLRSGELPEWDEFPQQAEGKELVIKFNAAKNEAEQTLRFRQRDVKQAWTIRLNDKKLGTLAADEKDTTIYLALPAGAIRDGENELKISCDGGAGLASDDIEIGEISITSGRGMRCWTKRN
jgi:hypothetical protein